MKRRALFAAAALCALAVGSAKAGTPGNSYPTLSPMQQTATVTCFYGGATYTCPVNSIAAATVTPPITITPTPLGATSASESINSTQSFSGTASSGLNGSNFLITSDNLNASTGFVTGIYMQQQFGGSAAEGGRVGLWIDTRNDGGATNSANPNRNYAAATFQSFAVNGDGGTGLTTGTAKGAFFGLAGVGIAFNGATDLLNVTGEELNTLVETGSSVALKSILQLSGQANDAVAGSVVDTMLWMYNQSGSPVAHKYGIYIDNNAGLGNWPISASGTIFKTGAGTVTNGIDFTSTTFSGGNPFASNGFTVTGQGIVVSTFLRPTPTTYSSLTALDGSPSTGDIAAISDANTCTANTTVSSGGGSTTCALVYSGTSWKAIATH